MKVKELGIYIPSADNEHQLIKVDFNRVNKEIWLDTIQLVKHYDATGGMSIPIDVYDCIFNIAPGIWKGKTYTSEKHKVIIRVCLDDWYMPEKLAVKELKEVLEDYPIEDINEVIQKLLSRKVSEETIYSFED